MIITWEEYSVRSWNVRQMGDKVAKSCCFCSVTKSCLTLCNAMNCNTPDFPVLHYLLEFAQIQVHWIGDAIQPSHPLLPPSPLVLNLSQHQGLFQWVNSSHQVAKVLELQLQHQVLPMNIQGWFPLELTGLISLQSKELSRIFSSTTIWKHSFKCMFLGIYQLFFYVVQFVVI